VLIITAACKIPDNDLITRPTDPWALRSVLDYHPRMLTLALNSKMYAAYDLENCRLYKAWRGGVHWDGIVYNDTKSVQPTSWGTSYIKDQQASQTWWIGDESNKLAAGVSFRGYRFNNEQIYLMYTLSTANDTVLIEERPEYVESKDGSPGLERLFIRSGTDDPPVYLDTQSQEVIIDKKETIFVTYFDPLPEQVPEQPSAFQNMTGKYSLETARYWLEKSDCFTCHEYTGNTVGPGFMEVAQKYAETDEVVNYLTSRIREGGSGVWGDTPMNPHPDFSDRDLMLMVKFILSLDSQNDEKKTRTPENVEGAGPQRPGFGASLEGVHPSYDLSNLDVPGYDFKVGGMAFLPDGRLVIATWSPEGSVFLLEGVESGDSSKIKVKRIAQGLAEPLGTAVVNGNIFVLQKHELTQLIDHDHDDITDEYRSICNDFGVSADFHEFAFGLVFKDDHFYANLSLPMRLMDNERPHPDRGRTIKIAMDGSFEPVNHGLRQPNGIGIGVDKEIFITDNQGQWLPGNKLIHVRQGGFHGMRWGVPDPSMESRESAPAVWLPQSEIGNSPSEPTTINEGPYKGQMLHGDVTHGGIKRVFLEKVLGAYQGAVFRFSQGFKAGVNRLRWGPDNALYIGQVGMIGGWSWKSKRSGLQRIKFNGKSTFEMLAIRSKSEGFQIEFTEPLADNYGEIPTDYLIQQWRYKPTPSYGGPKLDLTTLDVTAVKVSEDRKLVNLIIDGLKEEHVIYFRLNPEIKSNSGNSLWSGEAWYTLTKISMSKVQ
jgi:cytochrome c